MTMPKSECMSSIIIPRVLVPCEEPQLLQDRIFQQWKATPSESKKEITARLDEINITDIPELENPVEQASKHMLHLKFRNVLRVCISADVFKEFVSVSAVNTHTLDMGMMLMCVLSPDNCNLSASNTERWIKHDKLCPHIALIEDIHNPSEYTPLLCLFEENNQAKAIEDTLLEIFVDNMDKSQRPTSLTVSVSKHRKQQLLISGLESFDLASATRRLRALLIKEERIDILHTLVFNLLFQENSCIVHLYISQQCTLNGEADALCDIILQNYMKSCVSRLQNPSMEIVPFQTTPSSTYRDCMLQFPVSIPNPINIGMNVCTYIVEKVHRFKGATKARRVAAPDRRPY